MRWNENFTALLREKNLKIIYDIEGATETTWVAKMDGDTELERKLLKDFLNEDKDESFHELIRRNVMIATRNYKNRFDAFMKEIVMDKSNPMCITNWSAKLEFQGRGAPHNHGVLWADLKNMQYMFESYDDKIKPGDTFKYNLKSFEALFNENENEIMRDKILAVLKSFYVDKTTLSAEHIEAVREFSKSKLKDGKCDVEAILRKFKFFGICEAFKKFETKEDLLEHEERAVINFANKFTTVSLNAATVGQIVANIARVVSRHKHTRACKKYGTDCRFGFCKLPCWKTLIAKPFKLTGDEGNDKKNKYKALLKKVKHLLNDEEVIAKIIDSPKYDREKEALDKALYETNRELRIKELLYMAGLETDEDWNLYLEALQYSKSGFSVVMARDLDEINVNSFNPEWLLAWDGNLDLQICLDYFAVITYVTDYFTKDDTGTMQILRDALKNANSENVKEKMRMMMDTYITHRQMGEAEAIYKIFPDFEFKNSNVSCVFLSTAKRVDRSKFLLRVDGKSEYNDFQKIKIEGREGEFIEKYDVISKYERRIGMVKLCLSQFGKMYSSAW
jgi:hypothetical protein